MTLYEKYKQYQENKNSNVGAQTTPLQSTETLLQKYKNYLIDSYNKAYEEAKPYGDKLTSQSWTSQQEMDDAIAKWQKVYDYASRLGDEEATTYAENLKSVLDYSNSLKNVYGAYNTAEEYEAAKAENENAVDFKTSLENSIKQSENEIKLLQRFYDATADESGELTGDAFENRLYWLANYYHKDDAGINELKGKLQNVKSRTELGKLLEQTKAMLGADERAKEALKTQDRLESFDRSVPDAASKLRNNEEMTAEERLTYNKLAYIDQRRADKYFNNIEEYLNARAANKIYENIKNKPLARLKQNVKTGFSQTFEGIKNATINRNDDYYAPTTSALVSSKLKEDRKTGFGRFMHDATVTTSAMVPAIATSILATAISKAAGVATIKTVGTGVATGIIGTSAAGNARAEMINAGYSKAQADAYGTLVGISEAALSKLLTTVGGIGGKGIKAAVDKIDNALLSFAISNSGEALEEGLQTMLEPLFKQIVGGVAEPAEWGDILYSALLGYATSVALGGVDIAKSGVDKIKDIANTKKISKQELDKNAKRGNLMNFIETELPVQSVSYGLAQDIKNNVETYDLYASISGTSRAFTKTDEQFVAEALKMRGVGTESANYLAETLAKITNGLELDAEQQEALNRNTMLASVLLDMQAQKDARLWGKTNEYAKAYQQKPITAISQKPNTITERPASFNEDGTPSANQAMIKRIGKALGYEVVFDGSIATENGTIANGYIDGNRIVLNPNGKRALEFVLKHEITHSLEKMTDYYNFANDVFESKEFTVWVKENGYNTLAEYRKQYIEDRINLGDKNFAEEQDVNKRDTLADQEILADFVGDKLFNDIDGLQRLIDSLEPKAKRSFIEWLRDFLQSIKQKLGKADRRLSSEIAVLERKYANMLKEVNKAETEAPKVEAKETDKKNSITAEKDVKQKQLEIIQETNPMWDEYHTGIRTVDDILTWEEVLKLDDEREGQFVWGDFSRAEAEQALKDGTITVYSSYPIKNGVFVSTSQIQAQEYAGGKNGKVYSKIIPLTDVAWINGDEGQYAKTNITANTDVRYSVDNNKTAKNVYKYTEEQYNAFGWTRYDNILTNAMIERLTSKLYEMSEQNAYFHQTKNGEYIIPIGEDYGEYDVLVYTNGNYENPSITKVIKLQSEDEYLKEEIWRNLLNGKELTESIVTTTLEDVEAVYGTESIERFISRDSTSFQEYERGIERQISREIGNRVGKRNSVDRVGSESQADTKGNIRRNSITPETDAEYISAVKKGDTKNKNPLKTLKEIVVADKDTVDSTNFKLRKFKEQQEADRRSKFAKSLKGAKILSDEFKQEISTNDYINTYPAKFNRDVLEEATKLINEGGAKYVEEWLAVKPEKASLIDEAVGFVLLERCRRENDTERMINVVEHLRSFATSAGQRVQIFSILGKMTPEGMLRYAQKELGEALKVFKEYKTKQWLENHAEEFKLTEEDAEFITRRMRQASQLPNESRAQKIVLAEIATRIQNKIPAEKGQGIKAYQRISMLLNPKTQVRNILGNAASAPLFVMSDIFGAGIDKIVAKDVAKRGFDAQRTKGVHVSKDSAKAFARGAQESYEDWRKKINTRVDFDRYNVKQGKSFNENHKIEALNSLAKTFNSLDRFTSFLLEAGDRPFYEMWFTNSLNAQLKLNGVTEPTSAMLEIAANEALARTWQDDNGWTRSATTIKNALNTFPINLSTFFPNLPNYGLGDLILKFTKTPANLAKALVDFSPLGAVEAAANAYKFHNSLKQGKYDAKAQYEFVSSLSKAISGTLAQVVVATLIQMGLITLTGGNDDDKDVRAFENYILGIPEYSMKIGDKYYDYSWAMPLGVLSASVVDFMEAKSNAEYKGAEKLYQPILDGLLAGGKLIMEQTFFQSLHDFFSNGENIVNNIIGSLIGDTSVYVPTILAQFAELTDESRRATYTSDVVQRAINRIKSRIPILRKTLAEEKTVLGEISKNANYGSIYRAFFAPGNTYSKSDSEAVDEVYDLYKKTEDKTVIPSKAPTSVTVGGETYAYTLEEKSQIQAEMGSTSVAIIEELISLKEYQELTDEQKVELLKKVYSYALAKAKANMVYDYDFLKASYESLTEQKYNSFSDKQKKMLAQELFMSSYSKLKSGNEAEYFLSKIDKTNSKTSAQKKKEEALKKVENTK